MFITLVRNYIRALWWSIGHSKTIRRFKYQFELNGFYADIDLLCSFNKNNTNTKDLTTIISFYDKTISKRDKEWNLKTYLDVMIRSKSKGDISGYKTIQDFIEGIVLSEFDSAGVQTYINKMVVKSLSDLRNEKLSKLLSNK